MATFDASAATQDFNFSVTAGDPVDFASEVTKNATTYSWLTSGGHLVTATGTFTYDGSNNLTGGTVTAVDIDFADNGNTDVAIGSIANADILELIAGNQAFFAATMTGNDTITGAVNVAGTLLGDGPADASGALAGNDVFTGNFNGADFSLIGDQHTILGSGTFTGGNDTFTLSGTTVTAGSANVYADLYRADSGQTYYGGADDVDIDLTAGNVVVYGDTNQIFDATVYGGDDDLTATSGASVTLYGDVSSVGSGTTYFGILHGGNDTMSGGITSNGDASQLIDGELYGGDDTIDTWANTAAVRGDVRLIKSSTTSASVFVGGDDTINGSDGLQYLYGDIERIEAGAGILASNITFGNDTIHGGNDGDIIYGDYETDDAGILGPEAGGNDMLYGDAGADFIYGNGGDDLIEGGADGDTIDGGDGIDTASYENSDAAVTINLGTSYFSGGHAAGDTLTSIENLIGSAYADSLLGDANANRLEGGDGGDTLSGRGGDDIIDGGGGIDALYGNDGDDLLIGGDDDDTLNGQNDDDVLRGGKGGDALYGGAGNDAADYSDSGEAVTINLGTALISGGYAAGDTYDSIESLVGSIFDDNLTGDTGANTLEGGDGDDMLDGGDGNDTASYEGASSRVVADLRLDGIAWNTQGAGTDTLTSIENLIGSDFNDDLKGGTGVNTLEGGLGNDVLRAKGDDGDILYGGDGNDTLRGDAGDNVMYGGIGEDVLIGAQGADEMHGGDDRDIMVGSSEDDEMYGDGGNDELRGNGGVDTLYGGDGEDDLRGGSLGDFLYGGADRDLLYGENASDLLDGGTGDDTMTGGIGNDIFVYDIGYEFDRIRDFGDGNDQIDLSAIAGMTDLAAVTALMTQTATGHVNINFGSGDILQVQNMVIAGFDSGDFIYAAV